MMLGCVNEQALSAGGRLLAASERLDQLLRRQRGETARLAAVEQPAAAPASGQRYLPGVIGRLSKAMLSPEPPATDSSAPFLDDLHARVRTAWELRQQASYAALGDHLAVLIPDIEGAGTVFDGEDHEGALRLVVHTYNATSSLLKRLGDYDLGLLAADRAVRTAATLDDPVLAAAAAYRLGTVLLSATRFDGATEVTLRAAATIEPGTMQTPLSLASWGGLLLTAAVASARAGDESAAWELLGEARAAGRILGLDHADIHTIFGPTNVAVHAVQIAAELGNGRDAVERAERVDPDHFPPSLAERRGQFLIDTAQGHSLIGDDSQAASTLLRAEQTAPEEVRFNPAAHHLLHTLLGRERRSATPGLRELAGRMGGIE